jgi:quinol monooxygenase YgiN
MDVMTDIETQVSLREHAVTIVQKRGSPQALQAHLQAPHMEEYRKRVKNIVASLTLQVLEPR